MKTIFSSLGRDKGTALVETSSLILFVGLVTLCLIGLLYLTFAKIWIQHTGHKGLICSLQGQPTKICTESIRKNLRSALPIGEMKTISLKRSGNRSKIFLRWQLAGHRKLEYSKSLRYEE